MQRRDNDTGGYLRPPGICRRLFSLVVAKLMAGRFKRETLGQSEDEVLVSNEVEEDGSARNKLSKKESRSDIIIHFKQKEDSEENGRPANKLGSSLHEPPIKLVHGNGRKKTVSIIEKGKAAIVSELSPMQPVALPLPESGKSKPQKHHMPPLQSVVSNINEKSDAFITSRKEKMRKSLEPKA